MRVSTLVLGCLLAGAVPAFTEEPTAVVPPAGLSPHTTRRLRERAIPAAHTGSDPVQVGAPDLTRAARIVALKGTEHRPLLAALHPDWLDRIEYWEINDLDGSSPEIALAAIEAHVGALLAELERPAATGQTPGGGN